MFGINSMSLNRSSAIGGLRWTIANLFKNSETGFWYDPSDLTTLFQDSAGTTPVTGVEQPVGLMLDKSQGAALGAELWTQGSASPTGSEGTFIVLATEASVLDTGSLYKVEYTITGLTSGNFSVRVGAGAATTLSSNGSGVYYDIAPASDIDIRTGSVQPNAGSTITISVKEVSGSHATQSTSASCPTLSARYNLLEQTESFDDSYWNKSRLSVTSTSETDPLGTTTAERVDATETNANGMNLNRGAIATNKPYTASVYLKAGSDDWAVMTLSRDGVANGARQWFDITNGVVGSSSTFGTGWSIASASITDVGDGWFRCEATADVASYTTATLFIYPAVPADLDFDCTLSTTFGYIWGASLVESQYDSLPYQRVGDASTTASDYDDVGFPKYLKFDGTDDYMKVNGLSASSGPITAHFGYVTDDGETTGAQRILDISTGRMIFTAAGPNTIALFDDASGTTTQSDIDTEALTVATFTVAGSTSEIRVNGASETTGVNQERALGGTIALGRSSGGASNHTNGNLYSAILRSTTSTDTEIDRAEGYINRKMGGGLI